MIDSLANRITFRYFFLDLAGVNLLGYLEVKADGCPLEKFADLV